MAVVVAFGSFLTTLLGGYAAVRIGPYRNLVLGLAAGLMLGVVGFDLLPEALSQEPGLLAGIPAPLLAFVLGFLVLHVIEHTVGIHRGPAGNDAEDFRAPSVGLLAASGLVGHSVMDGFAIGAAFQAGSRVGAVVAVAVIGHDFADGFNTYTVTSLYKEMIADGHWPCSQRMLWRQLPARPSPWPLRSLHHHIGALLGVFRRFSDVSRERRHPAQGAYRASNSADAGVHDRRRAVHAGDHRSGKLAVVQPTYPILRERSVDRCRSSDVIGDRGPMPLRPLSGIIGNVGLDQGQDAVGIGAASYWRGHHARHRRDPPGRPKVFRHSIATVADVGAIE